MSNIIPHYHWLVFSNSMLIDEYQLHRKCNPNSWEEESVGLRCVFKSACDFKDKKKNRMNVLSRCRIWITFYTPFWPASKVLWAVKLKEPLVTFLHIWLSDSNAACWLHAKLQQWVHSSVHACRKRMHKKCNVNVVLVGTLVPCWTELLFFFCPRGELSAHVWRLRLCPPPPPTPLPPSCVVTVKVSSREACLNNLRVD